MFTTGTRDLFNPNNLQYNERTLLRPDGSPLRPDCFVVLPNNAVAVLDYKTGKPRPEHKDQFLNTLFFEIRDQVTQKQLFMWTKKSHWNIFANFAAKPINENNEKRILLLSSWVYKSCFCRHKLSLTLGKSHLGQTRSSFMKEEGYNTKQVMMESNLIIKLIIKIPIVFRGFDTLEGFHFTLGGLSIKLIELH